MMGEGMVAGTREGCLHDNHSHDVDECKCSAISFGPGS